MGNIYGCKSVQNDWISKTCGAGGRRNQVGYNKNLTNRETSLSAQSQSAAYNPNHVVPGYGSPQQQQAQQAQYMHNQPQFSQQRSNPPMLNNTSSGGPQQQTMPQMSMQYSNPYMSPIQMSQQMSQPLMNQQMSNPVSPVGPISPRGAQSQQAQQYRPSPTQIDPRLSGGKIIPHVEGVHHRDTDESNSGDEHSDDQSQSDNEDENAQDNTQAAANTPSRQSVFEMQQTMAAMVHQHNTASAMGAYGGGGGARAGAGGYAAYGAYGGGAGRIGGGGAYGAYGGAGGGAYGRPQGSPRHVNNMPQGFGQQHTQPQPQQQQSVGSVGQNGQ